MLINYRKKLDDIENNLIQMINNIVRANKCMLKATRENSFAFDECQNSLKSISDLAHTVDNSVLSTLALFSPEAKDLRELVAILKITNEVSRAKSNIKNYGLELKKAFESGLFDAKTIEKILLLQECSIKSFEYVSMMIPSSDVDISQKLYNSILAEEDKADEIFALIDQSIVSSINDDSKIAIEKLEGLKAIRKLEKVTDRAVGIADLIMFAQTGGELVH